MLQLLQMFFILSGGGRWSRFQLSNQKQISPTVKSSRTQQAASLRSARSSRARSTQNGGLLYYPLIIQQNGISTPASGGRSARSAFLPCILYARFEIVLDLETFSGMAASYTNPAASAGNLGGDSHDS